MIKEKLQSVTFSVLGRPAAQGSKRLLNRRTGALGESSKRLAPWRADVRAIAMLHRQRLDIYTRPILLDCTFKFARPKNHYGRRGGHLILKPMAPIFCTSVVGDVDKLLRAISDALTGVLYADDSQIVDIRGKREYAGEGEQEQAIITIAGY